MFKKGHEYGQTFERARRVDSNTQKSYGIRNGTGSKWYPKY